MTTEKTDSRSFDLPCRQRRPLVRSVLADLDTPVSAYLKLADGPYSYLFESVHGGEQWGRYSFIGLPCHERIEVSGLQVSRFVDGETVEQFECADPLAYVDALHQSFETGDHPELPPFTGGLVGYFGFDTVRYVEPRLAGKAPPDEIGTADILLLVSEQLLVFDNLAGRIHIVVHYDPTVEGDEQRASHELVKLAAKLRGPLPDQPAVSGEQPLTEADFKSGFTREGFEAAVLKTKQYILDGDVMQTVVSQRMSVPFTAPPMALYRSLRTLNPSPYLYLLNLGDTHVVGSSPEILARFSGTGEVTVRPIAGTRPRGETPEQDKQYEDDLLADPKELAEHLMLIDLGRNDVGRIAKVGEVKLTDKMVIERYSHVMHIVSNVTGQAREGTTAIDVLRATFPAGTLSGAPKIRALEIIDELEPVKRGIYGGAVGYLGFGGTMDTAIAIRTAVIKDGQLHIQAGAGLVADSVPATEWEETMNKGRAVIRAVAMAQQGPEQSVQQVQRASSKETQS